jgi:hypothetical protein
MQAVRFGAESVVARRARGLPEAWIATFLDTAFALTGLPP